MNNAATLSQALIARAKKQEGFQGEVARMEDNERKQLAAESKEFLKEMDMFQEKSKSMETESWNDAKM